MVAWGASSDVPNNEELVIAGFLYGLNTMLLTIRVFGQLMEATRFMGVTQIALFQIIGDVIGIFCQFLTVIIAFSFAITKVYLAETSYLGNIKNSTETM